MPAPSDRPEITDAVGWLARELSGAPFVEVGIRFIQHAGRIVRVEKTLTTKTEPDRPPGSQG